MASSSKAPTPWFLASAAEDVKLWRSGGQAEASPRARDAHAVRCVRFDNTGQLLGSCGDDGCVHITSVAPGGQQGAVTLRPDDSTAATNCFSFSSGSGYLSSGAADGVIRVWDTKQERVLQRLGKLLHSQEEALHQIHSLLQSPTPPTAEALLNQIASQCEATLASDPPTPIWTPNGR